MAYLFEQMAKPADPKVVFIGSSVVQGYGNCLPAPLPGPDRKEIAQDNRFRNARVFNMSSAGNRYGDHLATLVESLKYKPDLVVTAVHIKMFSRHSSLVKPFTRDEALYYFRDEPEFGTAAGTTCSAASTFPLPATAKSGWTTKCRKSPPFIVTAG
jgi:hypothetical protein